MYTLIKTPFQCIKSDDGTFIPIDENNRHYQEFVEWVNEGNKPAIQEEGDATGE